VIEGNVELVQLVQVRRLTPVIQDFETRSELAIRRLKTVHEQSYLHVLREIRQ
jgi:hypothetical protein